MPRRPADQQDGATSTCLAWSWPGRGGHGTRFGQQLRAKGSPCLLRKLSVTDWWLFTSQPEFFLFAWVLSVFGKTGGRQPESEIQVWRCATERANLYTARLAVLFLRASARLHPSPQPPTWLSYFRPDAENSSVLPVIQDGLNGQKLHSASRRPSLC